MRILIKSVNILDEGSPYNGLVKNVFVNDGKIVSIGDQLSEADQIIDGTNLFLSPGWFDMRVTIGDPGLEHKEDIISACNAAAFGGFTEIACLPNTMPSIQSKDVIVYIKSKSQFHLVQVYPMGAVTMERQGKDLTEMMDLHYAGAIAFTDGDKPIWHPDVLLKSLQYLKPLNALLINHAEEKHLTHGGQMNEGLESTLLGLKGLPNLAEELMIARDLQILEYTGGKIHFAHVSSPGSLKLIREARTKGLQVTCDVAAYTLALDDTYVRSFDSNLKVNPPLRTMDDINRIIDGVVDGTIDVIVSDHVPHEEESKKLEFDLAEFGMIGMETAFAVANTYAGNKIPLNTIVQKLTVGPRKILNLPIPVIQEGREANMTLFDPQREWVLTVDQIKSKSRNSPFIGKKLKGKAVAVFNKNKFILNQ